MKTTKSPSLKVLRARRTRLGRLLCKVAGDKTGAIMMEYVILAVLIAAAAVVAVAMFGKTIVGMFSVAGKGATGDHSGAQTELQTTRGVQEADAENAKQYHDSMHQ